MPQTDWKTRSLAAAWQHIDTFGGIRLRIETVLTISQLAKGGGGGGAENMSRVHGASVKLNNMTWHTKTEHVFL